MRNEIKFILNNYIDAKKSRDQKHEGAVYVRNDLRNAIIIDASIDSNKYKVKGSSGAGNIAAIPWVCIFDRDITESATKGYYIVYLFKADMSGVYLSLNQGWTFYKDKYGTVKGRKVIENVTNRLRKRSIFSLNDFTFEKIDLRNNGNLAKGYELGHICGKCYDVSDIPSDDQLVQDLKKLMNVYKELKYEISDDRFEDIAEKESSLIDLEEDVFEDQYKNDSIDNGVITNENVHNLINPPPFGSEEKNEANHNGKKSLEDKTQARAVSDRAAKEDYLDRDKLVTSIAKLLMNPNTLTPFSMGIFAGWGEGKSSIIRLVSKKIDTIYKSNLDKRKNIFNSRKQILNKMIKKNQFCHIDPVTDKEVDNYYKDTGNLNFTHCEYLVFDASHYDDREKIWASLFTSLYEKYKKATGPKGVFWFISQNIINKIDPISVLIYGVLVFIVQILVLFGLGELNFNQETVFFLASAPIISIIYEIAKNYNEFDKKLNATINKHNSKVGYRNEVKKDIELLIETWRWLYREDSRLLTAEEIEKEVDKPRIVIVFDELDRCTQGKIAEAIEAVQILLDIEGVITVLSLNFNNVCHVIGHMHSYTDSKLSECKVKRFGFGKKYLEKYVTLPIYLNSINDFSSYVDTIFKDIIESEDKIQIDLEPQGEDQEEPEGEDQEEPEGEDQEEPQGEDQEEPQGEDREEPEDDASGQGKDENEIEQIEIKFSIKEVETFKTMIDLFNKNQQNINPRLIKRFTNMLILSKELFYSYVKDDKDFDKYIIYMFYNYYELIRVDNERLSEIDQNTSVNSLMLDGYIYKSKSFNGDFEDYFSENFLGVYELDVNVIKDFAFIYDFFNYLGDDKDKELT